MIQKYLKKDQLYGVEEIKVLILLRFTTLTVFAHAVFQISTARGINQAGDYLFHLHWFYLLYVGWLMKKIYAAPGSNFSSLYHLVLLTTARYALQILTNIFFDNAGGHSTSLVFTLFLLFMNIGINLFLTTCKKLACTFFICSLCGFQIAMQRLYMAETELVWGTYSTEVRLQKIGDHLSTSGGEQAGAILPAMIIILFLESTTQIFISEILKIFAKQNILQSEVTAILANLEESIILKSSDEIKYSNLRGQKILNYLKKLGNTQNTEKVLDLKAFQMHHSKEVGD